MASTRENLLNDTQREIIAAAIAKGEEHWPMAPDLRDWLYRAALDDKNCERKDDIYRTFLRSELEKNRQTDAFSRWMCDPNAISDSNVTLYFFPDIPLEELVRRRNAAAWARVDAVYGGMVGKEKGGGTGSSNEAEDRIVFISRGEAKAADEQAEKRDHCFRRLLSGEKPNPSHQEVEGAVWPWPKVFWEVFLSDEYRLFGEKEPLTNNQRAQLFGKLLAYGGEIVPYILPFPLKWADEPTLPISEKKTGQWLYWRLAKWNELEPAMLSGTTDKNYIAELFAQYLQVEFAKYKDFHNIASSTELPEFLWLLKQLNADRAAIGKNLIFTPHIQRLEPNYGPKPTASWLFSCEISFWKPAVVAGAGAGLSGAAYYFGYLQLAATLGSSMVAGAAALLFLYLVITTASYLIDQCGCRQPSSDLAV